MGGLKWGLLLLSVGVVAAETDCFNQINVTSSSTNSSSESENFLEDKLSFTLSLFHALYVKGENLFFSPHSIHQALTLALLASGGGDTERELRTALLPLHPNATKATFLKGYKLDNYFRSSSCNATPGVTLSVANKYWVDKDETLVPCLPQLFPQEVEAIDLGGEGAVGVINSWVEAHTGGKIVGLIPELPKHSRLALVNSAYFKGTWEQQFKKSKSKLGLFYVDRSQVTPTTFMWQKGNFRHGVSEELKCYILELPYEGDSLSMFILLPPFTPNGLATTIAALSPSSLRRGMEEMVHDSIEVLLPRFKLSHTFSLDGALEGLGIRALFNSSSADLSGLLVNGTGLALDAALHKSYIEVNEEGATAAAGTALIGTRSGRPLEESRFLANHPFIFAIYDHCSKSILFIGTLHKPNSK